MAGYTNLPQNRDIATRVIDATSALELKRAEMGFLGRLLGDEKHRPGSIAFITILVSLCALCGAFFFLPHTDPARVAAIALFGGTVTTCVGYLFGKAGSH